MFAALQAIAESSGEGSQEQKLSQLVDVLSTVSDQEAKYIIRIVLGKLRLGFSDMTLIDALSWTTLGDKSEHDILEAAYQRRADIGLLATEYLHHADARERARALATIPVQVGVPVMPALCQRLNSTQEMIEKMGEVLAEPKYDGLRVQIHFNRAWSAPHVRTYTRNLEETTHMFPELSQLVGVLRCDQCILDGEAIGYDAATGHLRPFQETITRKRKHDVVEQSTTVPLRFFLFDVLCINEESLIDQPLSERKTRLTHILTDSKTFVQTEHITTSDANELRAFHEQCLAEGLEGMVAKAAAGTYQSGRKGYNWVKIKEEEGKSGKLSDTIDAVVMGYYRGRGKRAGFGIGAFLVGVLADDERIVTIAKIGTGVSDAQWHEMKQRCEALGELSAEAATEQYSIPKALKPDVSVVPGLIVEIAADEITRSPVHSAGVALRFPRLVKFRDDKNVSQATTVAEVEKVGGV
jgi:DNA ligase-1